MVCPLEFLRCYKGRQVTVIIRTKLEDQTLRAELPGYAEYARQTRFRLLPGIW